MGGWIFGLRFPATEARHPGATEFTINPFLSFFSFKYVAICRAEVLLESFVSYVIILRIVEYLAIKKLKKKTKEMQ